MGVTTSRGILGTKVYGKHVLGALWLLHHFGWELVQNLHAVKKEFGVFFFDCWIWRSWSHWRRWWTSMLSRTPPNHPLNELAMSYFTLRNSYNCVLVAPLRKNKSRIVIHLEISYWNLSSQGWQIFAWRMASCDRSSAPNSTFWNTWSFARIRIICNVQWFGSHLM